MATSLFPWKMSRVGPSAVALALGAATFLSSGCTTTTETVASTTTTSNSLGTSALTSNSFASAPKGKIPAVAPTGQPSDICTYWDKDLQSAPDTEHGGKLTPCVVGRMLLFDEHTKDICCDGQLKVTLYEEDPAQGRGHVRLEEWTVENKYLKNMLFKDSLGMWGYTLAMPTATCTPNVKNISLEVVFQPAQGHALYSHSGLVRLHSIASTWRQGTVDPAHYFHSSQPPATGQAPAGTLPGAVAPQALTPPQSQSGQVQQMSPPRFPTGQVQQLLPAPTQSSQLPPRVPAQPQTAASQQPQTSAPQQPQMASQLTFQPAGQ